MSNLTTYPAGKVMLDPPQSTPQNGLFQPISYMDQIWSQYSVMSGHYKNIKSNNLPCWKGDVRPPTKYPPKWVISTHLIHGPNLVTI